MRLTNTIRDAFVTSVLNDVPKVNYKEKAEKLVVQAVIDGLPLKIQEIYKDPILKEYLISSYLNTWRDKELVYNMAQLIPSLQIPCPQDRFKPNNDTLNKLQDLWNQNDKQTRKHKELQNKLRSVAYSVNTRKALVELLPEFEKYLPSEAPVVNRSLPTITNVISEFKQAGWPKPKE